MPSLCSICLVSPSSHILQYLNFMLLSLQIGAKRATNWKEDQMEFGQKFQRIASVAMRDLFSEITYDGSPCVNSKRPILYRDISVTFANSVLGFLLLLLLLLLLLAPHTYPA